MKRRELPITKLRRRIGQKVRHMTPEQASAWYVGYVNEWNRKRSIANDHIKQITGGLNSQSINAYVIRKVYDRSRGK